MSIGSFDERAREQLSALADGELDSAAPAALCRAWAGNADARRDWHAWHLIGDVLRSEDLASSPRHDRQLCAALRQRLQREAVVLAPMPVAAPRRSRWAVGSAVAAGFVLVVGTFVLARPSDPPATPSLARVEPTPLTTPTATVAAVQAAPSTGDNEVMVTDSRLFRDAQLDRYLAAHKQFAGSSALGVPSAFLRSATVDSAPR
jgi:sigma-E factor negative regulatory protein RseA